MLIKKSASRFELKSYLKKRSILIFIIFFLSPLFFTFLGVCAYHFGYAALVKELIAPDKKKEGYKNNYRIHVIKNFVRKPFTKVDKIYLDINFKNFKKLHENRNIALKIIHYLRNTMKMLVLP